MSVRHDDLAVCHCRSLAASHSRRLWSGDVEGDGVVGGKHADATHAGRLVHDLADPPALIRVVQHCDNVAWPHAQLVARLGFEPVLCLSLDSAAYGAQKDALSMVSPQAAADAYAEQSRWAAARETPGWPVDPQLVLPGRSAQTDHPAETAPDYPQAWRSWLVPPFTASKSLGQLLPRALQPTCSLPIVETVADLRQGLGACSVKVKLQLEKRDQIAHVEFL